MDVDTSDLVLRHSVYFATADGICIATKIALSNGDTTQSIPSEKIQHISQRIEEYKQRRPVPVGCEFRLITDDKNAFIVFIHHMNNSMADNHSTNEKITTTKRLAVEYLDKCFVIGLKDKIGVDYNATGTRSHVDAKQVRDMLLSQGLIAKKTVLGA